MLDFREFLVSHIQLSLRGQKIDNGDFDWVNAVLDAAIFSGITLCTGLGTLASSNALSATSVGVLVCAVLAEFLGILATKRGLVAAAKK